MEAIGCRRRVDGDRDILDDADGEQANKAGDDKKDDEQCEDILHTDHEFALQEKALEELGNDGREQWFPGDNDEAYVSIDDYIT